MTESEVVALVRIAIAKAGSIRALGRQWGVTPSYLCDLRDGRRAPGPKILDQLGLKRVKVVTYEPKKIGGRA